jgi:hypothetical protein
LPFWKMDTKGPSNSNCSDVSLFFLDVRTSTAGGFEKT